MPRMYVRVGVNLALSSGLHPISHKLGLLFVVLAVNVNMASITRLQKRE